MSELPITGLSGWDNFYVIVGSSGAALIGLQFVVITLITESRRRTTLSSVAAFGTPTVVHLAGALLLSAIMSAPWHSVRAVSVTLGVFGILGLAYCAMVIIHARRQTVYKPVWEDWLWHMVLPSCAYAAVALSAFLLREDGRAVSFVIAGSALGLLLISIHNAWDTVTYIVVEDPGSGDGDAADHSAG
jgi:lipid-A-disaccharide synthase-like uncharacterized protein